MELNTLELKNYCQHDDLFIEFKEGLNILTAPNGSGKTNLLNALHLMLSGELPGSTSLSEEIQWGKRKSELELNMTIQGMDCTTSRVIEPSSSDVIVDIGDQHYETKGGGYGQIFDCLNTNSNLMSLVPFVNQGEIHRIFFGKPAEQKKMLQKLFGTDVASSIRRLLRKELNKVTAIEVAEDTEDIKEKIVEKEEQIDDKSSLVRDITKFLEDCSPEEWQNKISTYASRLETIEQLSNRVKSLTARLSNKEEKKATLTQKISKLKREHEGLVSDTNQDELNGIVDTYLDEEDDRNRVSSLQSQLDNLENKLSKINTDSIEYNTTEGIDDKISNYREHIAHIKSQKKTIESFLDLESDDVYFCPECGYEEDNPDNTCPVCHQTLEGDEEYTEEERDELYHEIQEYKSKIKELQSTKSNVYKSLELKEEIDSVEKDLSTIDASNFVEKSDFQDARSTLKQIEKLTNQIERKEETLAQVTPSIKQLDTDLEEAEESLKEKEKNLPTQESIKEAKNQLEEYEDFKSDKSKLIGTLEQLKNEKYTLEERLNGVIALHKKKDKRESYRDILKEVREIMHSSCIPAAVASEGVRTLNSAIAKALDDLGTDFIAWRDEDTFEPIMRKAGGEPRPASKLSGGEKSLLGVAVAIARWNIFLPSVGFLALDEPTEFMDPDNQQRLTEFISTLQSYCKTTDKQLLIITNKPDVAEISDNNIQLGDQVPSLGE